MAFTDAQLLRLAHLNHAEFCRELGRWSGDRGAVHEEAGMFMWRTAASFPVVANGAMRLHPGDTDVALDACEAFFGGRGHSLMLLAGDDDDLGAAAEARGFVPIMEEPEMFRRSPVEERATPDGVELRWIDDAAGVTDFVTVNDTAYQSLGMPAGTIVEMVTAPERMLQPYLHTVVAYERNQPVAAAQTLVSLGIGGVYYVGVVPDARGKGMADLVTRAVTNRGFEKGAQLQTLQASPMGHDTYLRMGWDDVFTYRCVTRFEPPADG